MFRFIHTADWHLGKTLRNFSREPEHRLAFDQIIHLVETHQPHAFLIAGDIFDSPNPYPESQRLFYQTLARLHRACPAMTIVLTAGNHDAATRLEAPKDLFAAIQVHVIGNIRRKQNRTDAAGHLIPIADSQGQTIAHILAVSFPTASCLPAVPAEGSGSRTIRQTEALYNSLLNQTRQTWQGLPLVLTGHLHVQGATESPGSERKILIGGENAFPAASFPPEAAYVALGHLHKPQSVGQPHIRYSGSLFPLSAAEAAYQHGISLVTISQGKTTVEHLPLSRPVAFHIIPNQGFIRFDEVSTYLSAIDNSTRPFAQIRLKRDHLPTTFREQLDSLAEACGIRLVETKLEQTAGPDSPISSMPATTVADHDPTHFFKLAFEQLHLTPPAPRHIEVFHQACAEAAQ